MSWHFHCPTRIISGPGCRRELGPVVADLGARVAVVTGGAHLAASGELAILLDQLATVGLAVPEPFVIASEPDDRLVDDLAPRLRELRPDLVLAIGGGSVLDAAKALAALATNPDPVLHYLEGIPGRDTVRLAVDPLPVIAVPTTAGTGSEVTHNAVIGASGYHVKRSLRDPRLAPVLAVVDPELLLDCPRPVAAAAGMDAFAHLAESWLSTGASALTDVLALAGMERALRYLRQLAEGEPSRSATTGMSQAALWGGLCLSHARLGAAHGLVAPLGGSLPVPHGVAIAALTAPALHVTDLAVRERAAEDAPVHARLKQLSALIAGPGSTTALAAAKLDQLRQQLGLPGLAAFGLSSELIPEIAAKPSSSIRSHPIELSPEDLHRILERAL